ncbi:phage tail length tape measure family protein [Roseomonas sp. USHLN139]|uniref:phage tail length tape measure family protein n=1 Tax=Roseomonas sp. USHLN139 TaxID=3081298 RepID=UPI003B01DACC
MNYVARQVVTFDNQVSSGAKAATADLEKLAAAGDKVEATVTKVGRTASSLKRSFDPVTKAAQDLASAKRSLADVERRLSDDMAKGKTSLEEYNRSVAGATALVEKRAAALRAANQAAGELSAITQQGTQHIKLQAHEVTNLTYQLQDAVVQLAGGQNPFLIMMQQGPQATGAVGGTTRAWALLRQEMTASRVAIAGTALVFGTLAVLAEANERSLNNLQNRLRATRTDYEAMAATVNEASKSFAASSQFSTSDARAAGQILASSRSFTGTAKDLEALQRVVGDLATVMGQDLPTAAATLAQAMREPADVARELAEKQLTGFTNSLTRQVQLMELAGKRGEAYALVLDRVKQATAGAANNRSDLEKMLSDAKDVLQQAVQEMTPLATRFFGMMRDIFVMAAELDAKVLEGSGVASLLGLRRGGSASTAGSGSGGTPVVTDRSRIESALGQVASINPRSYQRETLRAQQQGLRDALNTPGITADEARNVRAALAELGAQYAGLEGPVGGFLRGLANQAKLAGVAEGAARDLAQAEHDAHEAARQASGGMASAAVVAEARALTQQRLNGQLSEARQSLYQQAEAQAAVTAAVSQGVRATQDAEDAATAWRESMKYGTVGSKEQQAAVLDLVDGYQRLRAEQRARAEQDALAGQDRQLQALDDERKLIGLTADERERELAALRERQKILAEGNELGTEESKRREDNARRIADQTRENTQLSNSWAELGRIGENAFDRVGDAITEAFSQGSLKAISFGQIARGVMSSVVQDVLKLGVINPALNALLGGARGTLGGALTVASGGSGGGLLGGAGSLLSGVGAFGNISEVLGMGSLTEMLGLGSLAGAGGLGGLMSTPLWGAGQMFGPMSAAAPTTAFYGAGTTTLGGALAGVGGGFAIGTLLNSLVGGKANGGMIGAGVGAGLGLLVGGPLGALIGGGAGGLLGGLFGPGKPNPAASVQYGVNSDGQLTVTGSKSKWMDDAEAVGAMQEALVKLNTTINSLGLSIDASVTGQTHFGKDSSPEEDQRNLTLAILEGLRGGSATMQQVIQQELGKAYGGDDNLDRALGNVAWVKDVYDVLVNPPEAVSAFQQSVDAVMASFDAAKVKATELGLATDQLVAKQLEQVFALQQQRDAAVWGLDRGLEIRRMRAGGQDQAADLLSFDIAAIAERAAYKANLESLGQSAEDVTARMLDLERTLNAERLSIVEQYAERARQAQESAASSALGLISNLSAYAQSLSFGAGSVLNPRQQFQEAQRQFLTLSAQIDAGDYSRLGELQGVAETYRQLSGQVNGSGTGYVDTVSQITNTLSRVSSASAQALTDAVFIAEQRSSTVQLTAAIEQMAARVVAAIQANNLPANAPARASVNA